MKKRKDGRYQKKVTLSNGTQRLVYGRTIAEVNKAANAVRAQDRAGLVVGDNTTVGEWARIWFLTYKSTLRANTQRMYRNAYNVHILPHIANMQLKSVRQVNVQNVMTQVSEKSESLQHKVLITLKQLFETARQNGLILTTPVEGIKITPHTKPPKKEYLTLEEQRELMESLKEKDPRARCFVALCLYCGLRREEAFGLQWTDISQEILTVNRAISFAGGKIDPSMELKTDAAHRSVPIPEELQKILSDTPRIGVHIVTCADGRPMTPNGFRRLWGKVTPGLPYHLHPHMLRHSYATNLYRAGILLKTAQYLLGHSTIQMTANIYTHMEKEDASSSLIQLEQYLSGRDSKEDLDTGNLQKVVKK